MKITHLVYVYNIKTTGSRIKVSIEEGKYVFKGVFDHFKVGLPLRILVKTADETKSRSYSLCTLYIKATRDRRQLDVEIISTQTQQPHQMTMSVKEFEIYLNDFATMSSENPPMFFQLSEDSMLTGLFRMTTPIENQVFWLEFPDHDPMTFFAATHFRETIQWKIHDHGAGGFGMTIGMCLANNLSEMCLVKMCTYSKTE